MDEENAGEKDEQEMAQEPLSGHEVADAEGKLLEELKKQGGAAFDSLWEAISLCEKLASSHMPAARPPLSSTAAYLRTAVHAHVSMVTSLGIGKSFWDLATATKKKNTVEALLSIERSAVRRARYIVATVEEGRDRQQLFKDASLRHIGEQGGTSQDVDAAKITVAAELGRAALDRALAEARTYHALVEASGL